jgi:hypothetical protein
MAAQNETTVRVVETVVGPQGPKAQICPIKADDAQDKSDDWPSRNASLTERFLHNLRLALAIPHT